MSSLFGNPETVTGTVVTLIDNLTNYGTRTFITIQCDGGALLFGTKPKSLPHVQRGYRVRITARIDWSEETGDGFFSFVRDAEVLDEPQVEVPDARGVGMTDAIGGGDNGADDHDG